MQQFILQCFQVDHEHKPYTVSSIEIYHDLHRQITGSSQLDGLLQIASSWIHSIVSLCRNHAGSKPLPENKVLPQDRIDNTNKQEREELDFTFENGLEALRFQQECNVCKQSQIIGATSMIKKFRFMSVLKSGCCRWRSISQILLQMQPWTLRDQSIKLHNSRASALLSLPPLSALQTEGELQPTGQSLLSQSLLQCRRTSYCSDPQIFLFALSM